MAVNLSILIILLGIFLRCAVSLYGYSGEANPPMFGDYEAQRHWMEITYNLHIKDWYFNTTANDLLYWGLDYPPLTAYHSWVCGAIANYVDPKYVELFKSRGFESPEHKIFMRNTVIVADLLTFFVAAIIYSILPKSSLSIDSFKIDQDIQLLILLSFPGLILIDHGHFQYNCVSLGFALFSIIATMKDNDILASILFCLALNYKQMILYYSLPIFFYYLGNCKNHLYKYGSRQCFIKFLSLALSVIVTTFLIWLPFMYSREQVAQVLHRLFPLERGIFEDKVSNFWCLVNVLIKFRNYFSNDKIALACAILTLMFSIPSCVNLFKYPTKDRYLLACINSSLAFFMFSYQVHEKTILLVCLPTMLCLKREPLHCFWLLNIATLSMLPLFIKDNLILPFLALNLLFILLVYAIFHTKDDSSWIEEKRKNYFILSMLVSCVLTIVSISCKAPQKYPDLFPLIISSYCALHFFYFLIYFTLSQLKIDDKIKSC